jgi:hypothetical protein
VNASFLKLHHGLCLDCVLTIRGITNKDNKKEGDNPTPMSFFIFAPSNS